MTIRAPAKAINHLPALSANKDLPPKMVDTRCGLKRFDGKRTDLDIVHSQRPLTCQECMTTLSDQEGLWDEYLRTPSERCHLCGRVSATDPCRPCNKEIADRITQQVLEEEVVGIPNESDYGESD